MDTNLTGRGTLLAYLNGACKMAGLMPTLDKLCSDMAATGRSLTPRAARDWWTKGLLPRPRRHGLGRGKGTETFWTEPRILDQAKAAYDLLAAHPRADTAILGLWLWGFPMELASIRAAYGRLISRHFSALRGRSMLQFDDAVGELAGRVARKIALSNAPEEARNAIADLTSEFLGIFYGVNGELTATGLRALWKKAAPYFGKDIPHSRGSADIDLPDDLFEILARNLIDFASLPAQRKAVTSATDYELIRARRLVRLVFGFLGRLARAASREEFEELGRRALIVFGRPAVPILIPVLRDESLRQKTVSFILDFVPGLRQTALGSSTKTRSKWDVRASDR